MKTKRTTEEIIAAVVGNGPFETEDIVRVRRLAQLGARVLEILRDQRLTAEGITRAARATNARAADAGWLALDAARSLGLLGKEHQAALAADQVQPETPKGGETSPRVQSVQAPYEVQAKATGSSPAVPPAPLGLEEQLRAIWSEEYDRSVSPTAVPRDEHWRMTALRRAAAETPLARLGAFVKRIADEPDTWQERGQLSSASALSSILEECERLMPEPDRDTK